MDRIHVVARPSSLRFHSHVTGWSLSDLWESSPPAKIGEATSEGIGKVSTSASGAIDTFSTMLKVFAAVAIVGAGAFVYKELK